MSLSELSVLSELNVGVLRLFASDRDLAGVLALSSLFSSLTLFIFILFISVNSSLRVPDVGRLPDVESVRAGEWERDDDAEL